MLNHFAWLKRAYRGFVLTQFSYSDIIKKMAEKKVAYLLKILFYIVWLLSLYVSFLVFFLDLTYGDQINKFLVIIISTWVIGFIIFIVSREMFISASKENNEKHTISKITKRPFLIIIILVFFIALNCLFFPKIKEKIDNTISFRDRGCAFGIVGRSMEPTLKDGWVEATDCCKNKGCLPIDRGDLIIYDSKINKEDRIKRIIGLPNEEIIISEGKIYINGEMLIEPYLGSAFSSTYLGIDLKPSIDFPRIYHCGKVVISEDKFFVLGDNRMHSSDSRDEGLIDLSQIKAIAKYKDRGDPEKYFGLSVNDNFIGDRGVCLTTEQWK